MKQNGIVARRTFYGLDTSNIGFTNTDSFYGVDSTGYITDTENLGIRQQINYSLISDGEATVDRIWYYSNVLDVTQVYNGAMVRNLTPGYQVYQTLYNDMTRWAD